MSRGFQEPGATAPCVVCGKDAAENAQDVRTGLFYPVCRACQQAALEALRGDTGDPTELGDLGMGM
jgi:hypothetical protein